MKFKNCFLLVMLIISQNLNGLKKVDRIELLCRDMACDALCVQECRWTPDIVEKLKRFWKGDFFYALAADGAAGVAIFVKQGSFEKVEEIFNDEKGRAIVIELGYRGLTYRLHNVYAPNIEAERKSFFQRCRGWTNERSIIIGDMNVALSKADVGVANKFKSDTSRSAIQEWMADNDLVDAWRVLKGGTRVFSRRQVVMGTLKQSRIDLCLLASDLVPKLSNCKYIFCSESDHASLRVTLEAERMQRNGGVWCFNSSLLTDESFRSKMAMFLSALCDESEFITDLIEWWERAKLRIKKRCIALSREIRGREKKEETELRDCLRREIDLIEAGCGHPLDKYLELREQLKHIQERKCRGAMIRSKTQFLLEGERCTAFFLGLEKKKQIKSYIAQITDADGNKCTDLVDILQAAQDYYTNLFRKQDLDSKHMDRVIGAISCSLGSDDMISCDGDIQLSEVKGAIATLNRSKSPGADGLSAEFYQCFSNLLAPILCRLFTVMQEEKRCADSFLRGVITLVFKNKGDRYDLANYRPISLLNVDYKILAKLLACRLKRVIGTIIGPTQTYSIPGRDIADCILSTKFSFEHLMSTGGVYVSVDLEKAFDRVSHEYLFQCLRVFGFGPVFRSWIEMLYGRAASVIKCNGSLTDPVPLERSIRQGCPLSAMLYAIAAEPLAQSILKDPLIRGIETPRGNEFRIAQYADDINVMVKDCASLRRVMLHLEAYELAAGAKVNKAKSCLISGPGIDLGEVSQDFRRSVNEVRLLGVHMGPSAQACTQKTWTEQLAWCRSRLALWKMRQMGLKGKVVIINSLIVPRLVYAMQVCSVPHDVMTSLCSLVDNFLWNGRANMIAHRTLIGPLKKGGVNLCDLRLKVLSLRIKLFKKLLNGKTQNIWADYMYDNVIKRGSCGLYNLCSLGFRRPVPGSDPLFQEAAEAWVKILPQLECVIHAKTDVLNQPLFGNPCLGGRAVLPEGTGLVHTTLKQVKDIVDTRGHISSQTTFERLKNMRLTITKRQVVKLCKTVGENIQIKWLEKLYETSDDLVEADGIEFSLVCDSKNRTLTDLPPKFWYKFLVSQIFKTPTAESKWLILFPQRQISVIWSNLHGKWLPPSVLNTNYKLRHRRVFTSVSLHQMNKQVYSRTCAMCKAEDENFEHFFLYCTAVRPLRDFVQDLLVKKCRMKGLEGEEWDWVWCFGIMGKAQHCNVTLINFLLSFARHVLFYARNLALYEDKHVAKVVVFKNMVKFHLEILFSYDSDWFISSWGRNNDFCIVEREKTLVLDFG